MSLFITFILTLITTLFFRFWQFLTEAPPAERHTPSDEPPPYETEYPEATMSFSWNNYLDRIQAMNETSGKRVQDKEVENAEDVRRLEIGPD